MFKNYLRSALRNLLKSKAFSAINIFGLAVGMASAILISLWIVNEWTYDNFHAKKDRIYEAWNRSRFSGEMHAWSTTPKILARSIEKDLPEVEMATRVNWGNTLLFSVGDKRVKGSGNVVDSNVLQVFSFPLIKGNPVTALYDPHSIVVTRDFARKLFDTEDALGKVVKVDNRENYTVTGVAENLPVNSRFNFEYLLPWAYVRAQGFDDNHWGNNSTKTYVLLKPGASIDAVNQKMLTYKWKYDEDAKKDKWAMFLYPLNRWHLYSKFKGAFEDGGLIDFVKLFAIVAIFIVVIACINFMNLSTARSEKRAKEVGIRKVSGAPRSTLIAQFLGESILLALIAGILSLIIVQVSLPGFNTLTGKELSVHYASIWFWLAFFGFIIFTGVLAGSYPAFFLSSFRPIKVLKGTFKSVNKAVTPRKILVVTQFTFAIVLIICTIIVKQQISYAKDRETGYNKDKLVYVMMDGDIRKNYLLIRQDLISSGAAVAVSKVSQPLTQRWSDSWGFGWEGKDPADKTDFSRVGEDENLGKTAGLQFVAGRDLDLQKFPTDSTGLIINEAALKVMKFKQPIGQIVTDNGGSDKYHIVGVFKDFIMESPYLPVSPMLIFGSKNNNENTIHFRLNPANTTEQNLAKAGTIFKKYNPEYPFEYKFVDAEYDFKFQNEKRTGTLATLFAILTVVISCLGLFGLASYMAEARFKEIGIRKVLGASVSRITTMLSKDFLTLVMISFCIAAPIAWYAMYKWLQNYDYRTGISILVFVLAGVLSMLVALLTVSFQAARAALANPTKSIKAE